MSDEQERVVKVKDALSLEQVRWKLAALWFIGGAVITLLLITQSVLGKYPGKVQNVWSWALPTIMPTLSLIITVLGANAWAVNGADDNRMVRRTFFRVAYGISASYLLLVLASILVEPFTPFEPVELLNLSSLWLAPFQGLAASAIAILFFTGRNRLT